MSTRSCHFWVFGALLFLMMTTRGLAEPLGSAISGSSDNNATSTIPLKDAGAAEADRETPDEQASLRALLVGLASPDVEERRRIRRSLGACGIVECGLDVGSVAA